MSRFASTTRSTRSSSSIVASGGLGRAGRLHDATSPTRRVLRAVALLGLVGALVAAGLAWSGRDRGGLDGLALVGTRGPACVRFVVAADVSGSMSQAASARDAAVQRLLEWLGTNLRPDDEVALLAFAAEVGPVTGPVLAGDLAGARLRADAPDGVTTVWQPVLDAVAGLPAGPCDTALLVISDAQLTPLPATVDLARSGLLAAGVHDLVLLVPTDGLAVPAQWSAVYPGAAEVRFDGTDERATERAIAATVATLTGQRLARG